MTPRPAATWGIGFAAAGVLEVVVVQEVADDLSQSKNHSKAFSPAPAAPAAPAPAAPAPAPAAPAAPAALRFL
jgi:hypothetical protein